MGGFSIAPSFSGITEVLFGVLCGRASEGPSSKSNGSAMEDFVNWTGR